MFRVSVYVVVMLVLMMSNLMALRPGEPTPRLRVAVTIQPQLEFVKEIGGKYVDVVALIPPGASPAVYDPSFRTLVSFSKVQLYIMLGHLPFEKVYRSKLKRLNKDMVMMSMSDGLGTRQLKDTMVVVDSYRRSHDDKPHHSHGGRHHGHADGTDPHVWLSPQMVMTHVQAITEQLIKMDPDHASYYIQRQTAYLSRLEALHERIQERLSRARRRDFLVFHPTYGYFADDYGLRQVAVEFEGKVPTPKQLKDTIEYARVQGIKTVFVQATFNPKLSISLARAIKGRIVRCNPLASDYIDEMEQFSKSLSKALR